MHYLEHLELRTLLAVSDILPEDVCLWEMDQLTHLTEDMDAPWEGFADIPTRLLLMTGGMACGIVDGAIHAVGIAVVTSPVYFCAKLVGVGVADMPKWVHALVGIGVFPTLKSVLDIARSATPTNDPLIKVMQYTAGSLLGALDKAVDWMDAQPCMENVSPALLPSKIYKAWEVAANLALCTAAVHMGYPHLPEYALET